MMAGLAALAIAAAVAIALAGAAGEAMAQTTVTYTAASTSKSTTTLTFSEALQLSGSALTTSDTPAHGEWMVYDPKRPGSAAPATLSASRGVTGVDVTTAGASPVLTLTHANLVNNPYPIVQYAPSGTPSLAGASAAVSTDAVVGTPSAPAFTAEVRDNSEVVITFVAPVTHATGNTVVTCARPSDPDPKNAPITGMPYLAFTLHRTTSTAPYDYDCDGKKSTDRLYPTGWTPDIANNRVTLSYAGERAVDLPTSTPGIVYAQRMTSQFLFSTTAAGTIINGTSAIATDNASPVAFAEFTDEDTIRVRFSEEMAMPSMAARSSVAVSTSSGAATISGTPTFTAHTDATASAAFVQPTLDIDLTAAASPNTEYTITFPSGFRAAGGPADKRAVATATAMVADTDAPTFVVHKLSNTRLMVTFSEEVREKAGTTANLDDWQIDTTPGSTATNVSPTRVTLGPNYADLTIAAVGDAVLPTVSYVEATSTIEDLAGNALAVTSTAVAAIDAPIPLSATHTRAAVDASQITVTFSEAVIGTTSASDWSVAGATVTSVTPASAAAGSGVREVSLSGFMLPGDAIPYVTYSGTGLTRDDTGSPPAVATRAVRAADGVPPTIVSARTISSTAVQVTMSEALAQIGADSAWKAAFGIDERDIDSTGHSEEFVTLRVAAADAWGTSQTPDVRYYGPASASDRATDRNGVAMVTQAFAGTTDDAPPELAAEVTGIREITVTFSEALSADPTRSAIAWGVATAAAPGTALAQISTSPLTYTAATEDSPATVAIAMNADLGAEAHVVTVTSTEAERIAGATGGGQVALTATATAPAPATPAFTAAMESLTTLALTFNTRMQLASGVTSLTASHWTVDSDGTADSDTADDITVSSATLADDRRRLVLVLDGADAQLGDTSKAPHVSYAAASGSEELENALGTALAMGTSAVAADRAPPRAMAAAFTAASTISVTLSEAVEAPGLRQASVYPSLGDISVSASGTTVTIEGTRPATDGVAYLVRMPGVVVDMACAGAAAEDMCVPNMFTDEVVSAVHEDSYAPTFTSGSASFPTSSLLAFRVSEPLAEATLSRITVSPSLGTITATQTGLEVGLAFTGTATASTMYTISIPATVTDAADPPNAFSGATESTPFTQTVTYAADSVAPTFTAALTAADTITITFSEPVRGSMSTTDWPLVFGGEGQQVRIKSLLSAQGDERRPDVVVVSAPGHDRATSITIPQAEPVSEVYISFFGQPTDTVLFVRYTGTSLMDRQGNIVERQANDLNSIEATDMAGPEPQIVFVNPVAPRARQMDANDLGQFSAGTLLVRPGDMVRFTVNWNVIDTLQETTLFSAAQYAERLASPTISYFGGEPVAMERGAGIQTFHTLTVPEGAPEGPFRPTFTATDRSGNVQSVTSARGINLCDTGLGPTGSIAAPANHCDYNSSVDFDKQDPRRLPRVYPTVDSSAPVALTARAVSGTQTLVTFNEPVGHLAGSSAQRAAHWTMTHGSPQTSADVTSVADARPLSALASEDYTVTLTHAAIPAADSRTVSYALGDAVGRVVDRVDHELASFGPLAVSAAAHTTITVSDPDGAGDFAARGGGYAHYANLGDRVTVRVAFLHDVATAAADRPRITVNSDDDGTATTMTVVSGSNDREWTHSFEVADADMEGALDFEIAAMDTASNPITFSEDTVQGNNAIIDLTAPEILHASIASLSGPARTFVVFDEEVMVPSSGWSLDSALPGRPGLIITDVSRRLGSHDTAQLTSTRAQPGVPYSVTVPAALADLAGNAYDASVPGPVATWPVQVITASIEDGPSPFTDRTANRLANAGDRITVAVTFSEDVIGTPMITVNSDADGAQTAMTAVSGTATRGWTYQFTVADGDTNGPLDFDIEASVGGSMAGEATIGEASIRPGSGATIDTTAPMAQRAEFVDRTTVEVTFSEAITVPTAGWTVQTTPSGAGDLTVSSPALKSGEVDTVMLTVTDATSATEYTVGIPAALEDLAGNARGAPATLTATYTAPGEAPEFTAATSAANTIVVTFDEVVELAGGATAPDASRWYHYEAAASPPTDQELAAAVTAGTNFDTAALSADGLTLTLALTTPHTADAASDWDSADPGDTPSAIGYSIPSGGSSDLADSDGNPLAHNTADTPVDDGAPPAPTGAVTATRMITLTFLESPTSAPNNDDFEYSAFDASAYATEIARDSPDLSSLANRTADGDADDLAFTAATSTAPATLVIPTKADVGSEALVVVIAYERSTRLTDGTNEIPDGYAVDVPAAALAFTAATTALDSITVTLSRAVQFAGSTTALSASNWIVDPDGSDGATNSAADDITVSSATFSATDRTVTLALDADDAQIGDTTKTPYIEYTGTGEIETTNGDALAAGTSATATDGAPPVFTARTERIGLEQTLIRISFSEAVTGTTVNGEWFTGVDADLDTTDGTAVTVIYRPCVLAGVQQATAAPSIDVTSICGGDASIDTIYLAAPSNDSDATPTVEYRKPTATGSTPIVSASSPATDLLPGPVTATDGRGPLFSAATSAANTITVTFDEAVMAVGAGAPDASRWYHYEGPTVPPSEAELAAAVTAGTNFGTAALSADGMTLTLTLTTPHTADAASGWDSANTGDTPDTIGYNTLSPLVADLADALGNGLAHNTLDDDIPDGAPPVPTAVATAARAITVTFHEALSADPTRTGITWVVTTMADTSTPLAQASTSPLTYTAATAMDPATVVISMAADLAAVTHTVTITSTAGARIADDNSLELPLVQAVPVSAPDAPPTFTAETVRIDSTNYIKIDFSEAVTGMTVSGEWFTGVDTDPDTTDGTAVANLARICATSPLLTITVNVGTVCSGDTMPRSIYLEYSPSDSSSTPTVEYRAPMATGSTPIVAADNMAGLSPGPVTATDGTPPAITAVTTAADTIVVTFDEAVSLAGGATEPDASRWYHYESATTPPSEAELAAAVTAGTNFDTATLSADGLALTLALTTPHTADAASGWDSANPGDTPDTIGYNSLSPLVADLADAQGNGLAHNTVDAVVDDMAPPLPTGAVTGRQEITLTFLESPTRNPRHNNFVYHAYQGSDSSMNFTASGRADMILTWTPATSTAPATLLIPTRFNLGSAQYTVSIANRDGGQLQDSHSNRLSFPALVNVPAPTALLFTASTTSLTEIVLTLSADAKFAGATTALSASNWIVDPDGSDGATNSAADDITVSAAAFSAADDTITLTLDADDAQIGDTTKTPYVEYTGSGEVDTDGGLTLSSGASAVATDNAPPQIVRFATGSTGTPGTDPNDPADNVYTDHVDVTASEPVTIESGATPAQRAGHWTVTHDHDGDMATTEVAITVTDAALVLADPADTASRTVRLALASGFAGTDSTPTVAYNAASSASGRLVMAGSASTTVASVPATAADDGIGPRLVALPVRGDFTPATPNDDDGNALVFTFSEDLDPASVGVPGSVGAPGVRSAMGVMARLQIDAASPTGFQPPIRHDDGACSTSTRWGPAVYDVARVGSTTVTDLADIVDGQVSDGMGGMEAGMVRGTQANTVRIGSPTYASETQRIFWFCFNEPSSDYDGWVRDSAVLDVAGNPYVGVEEPPYGQFIGTNDDRAPAFTAVVTSMTEISVFYDEPVRLAPGASIDASEWRIDTTPNVTTDNSDGMATWVTPTSVSHSFGPMLRPQYWAYGEPNHLVPTDARLRIVLTVDGAMFDPDQGLETDGTTDNRPRIHYTSSGSSPDAEDVYGNPAAATASAQARDSIPPAVTSLTVGVSTASTETAPVPSTQHARASSTNPVDIKFSVTFDEDPDSTKAPLVGILAMVNESTTVAATSGDRDNARVYSMTKPSDATDERTWEYTWRVTDMLPGESTPRAWGSGFELFYGILVQDSDGNALVYTQDSPYPSGSMARLTLDSEAPQVRAVEMRGRPAGSDAAFTSTAGRPGNEIELHFTVAERPDRLVSSTTASGGAVTYTPGGLAASAVSFFSGADTVQATSLSAPEVIDGLTHYRATATIPAGHAEGTDNIEWSISGLDIFGWPATTDSSDIGMTGHPDSLGFTVDTTAPMIVAASSHVGVDTTGGTRLATDALMTAAGAGTSLLVDITFDEAISGTPQVKGVGERLIVNEDGTGRRATDFEFHPAAPMTAVDGEGNTRWQHTYTVPAMDTEVHHDSLYRVELIMPMDEAGNTLMTCTGCAGLNDVQVDNVAPTMTELAFVHQATASGQVQWAAIEYTDHGGLQTSGLRAYLNDTSTDALLAGAGTLLVRVATPSFACIAATPTCVAADGDTEDSAQGLYFQFDYGAGTTMSAVELTDRAGNPASWDQPPPGPHPVGMDNFPQPSGFRDLSARFANADEPLPVRGSIAPASIDLASLGLGPATESLGFDVTYSPPAAAGASLRLFTGTDANGLPAANPAITLASRAEAHAQRGETYYAGTQPDDASDADDAAAHASLAAMGAAAVVDAARLESPATPVLLSSPARVTIPGVAESAHVYWISRTDTADATDDRIHSIQACGRGSSADTVDAADVASRTQPDPLDPSGYAGTDNAECYVRDRQADAIHIWTNHFTPFGASLEEVAQSGGSGCDDCSPPTLGVDSTGARQVVGGFTYNGAVHNVDYYYTPMPLIEVETGVENVAILKIYEDSGIDRLAHAGLAFGLGRGQHFAEADAEIRVSISHGGELSIALDDESGAIDRETLRVDRAVEKCMPGGEADCTVLTIHHTFLEPLDFDVVSTNVWDTRRNAWQNFYNHGVHVDGRSLNPQRGIEVNGGEMVLYPLISARVDEDGDGIYDYDERHVTYMLDEGYGVWRLTPDGTYAPLRNLRALHHEVDDSMYADGRIRTHGAERSSELFAVEVSRQAAIAEAIMAEMGIAVEANEMPEAEPSPYEGMSVEPRLERLSEEIAREINVAERLVASMLVAPAGADGE